MVYQGPVPLGYSEQEFRETGRLVREYQGPVQPGVSEEEFRRTGRTTPGPTTPQPGEVGYVSPEPDQPPEPALMPDPDPSLPTAPPTTISKPTFFEHGVGGRVKRGVTELGEGAEALFGGFGLIDRRAEEGDPFEMVPEVSPTGRGATAVFRPVTKEERTPEQELAFEGFGASTTAFVETKRVREELTEKYQEKINLGEIELEQARKQMQVEFGERTQLIEKQYRETTRTAEKEYGRRILLAELPFTFAKGLVFGGITALAPPVGLTLAGLGIGETAFKWGATKEMFTTYPKEMGLQVGAGLLGAGLGGYGTARIVRGIRGAITTARTDPLAISGLTTPEVLTGRKTFPTADPRLHLKMFKTSPYKLPGEVKPAIWHTTSEVFAKTTEAGIGKSELAGLYGAYGISPHFLRLSPSAYGIFGLGLKSVLEGSPGIIRITPRGILGAGARRIKPGKRLSYVWTSPVEKGYAFVPGIKPEVEAVIPPGTKLLRTQARFYTEYKGTKIPIYEFKALGKGVLGKQKGAMTLSELSKSYSYGKAPRTPFISPTSIIKSLGVSKYTKLSYGKPYRKTSLSRISYSSFLKGYRGLSYGYGFPRGGLSYGYGYSLKPLGQLYPPKYPTRILGGMKISGFGKLTSPDLGFGRKPFKESFGRPTFYQPSLVAISLGITAPRVPTGISRALFRPRVLKYRIKRVKTSRIKTRNKLRRKREEDLWGGFP